MENLNVKSRENCKNNHVKKNRKKGLVPGILYGKGMKNLLFEIGELELNHVIVKEGSHGIFNIQLDGENHDTLIKEVQRDPVSRKIIHIDLEKIDNKKKIVSNIPIHYVGETFINNKIGAILQKDKDSIKVKCTADNLPKFINIDVSRANIGDQFKVSDVEFSSEISIIDSLDTVIASIGYEQKLPENIDIENYVVVDEKTK